MDNVIQDAGNAKPALSDSEKAEKTKQTLPARSGKFVRYTGAKEEWATMRRIKPDAWATLGITADRTHVWDRSNDHRIPVSQFNEAQLDYLLDADGRFELVDAAGKTVAR